MTLIDLNQPTGAVFSDDRLYRYALWRRWNKNLPMLLSIGLNPSKASEFTNDPTVTRDMVRAVHNGFGGVFKANLYAYVSTNPNALLGDGDFVGEETDYYLKQMIEMSVKHLIGWGSFKPVRKRADDVLRMIPEPYCLGINKDGQPKHPLYVSYVTPMMIYKKEDKGYMSKVKYPYQYKIKLGNKVVYRGFDERLIKYFLAANPLLKVEW